MKLVAYSDATSFGGAEQVLANLLEALDPAYEIRCPRRRPGRGRGDHLGARRHEASPAPARKEQMGCGTASAARSLGTSAASRHIHANLWTSTRGHYGVGAALLTPGVRTVVVEQAAPLPSKSPVQRFFKRAVSRLVSAHVSVGEASARAVEEAVGLPRGSVRTIYNGVPDKPLEPLPRLAEGPVIGSLGRLSRRRATTSRFRRWPRCLGRRSSLSAMASSALGSRSSQRSSESLSESGSWAGSRSRADTWQASTSS